MRRIFFATAFAVLLVSAILMMGLGCSDENSMGPAEITAAGDISQAVVGSAVGEPTFVETFDLHSNVGGWSFFGNPHNRIEVIEPKDGNPGAFLHATCDKHGCLDTYAPQLRTPIGEPSIFTGNYRDRNVTRVGVDIAIFGAAATGGRPLSLLLRNENGTPYDFSDDVLAFWTGTKPIPQPNGLFKEFEIDIPSHSTTLPKGWKIMSGYSTGDDDADWNTVINDVSQITFFFGDPEMFFMFQLWDIGVDNVSIWYDQ
ncbi:MAG: hypothetical protein JSU74_10880 [Candidatus Zixiibacteriota bacterium]|nr:MAG: hypothetical protein JSU74_10880 [candidate division Zixibacteria bacterium]